MNKFLTKVAKLFLGLFLAAGVGVAVSAGHKDATVGHATDATANWAAANMGLGNGVATGTDPYSFDDDSNITISFTSGGTPTAYYTTGGVRIYNGGTFVISSSSGNISAITLSYQLNSGATISASPAGGFSSGSTSWSGDASSVTFTAGTKKHVRLATLQVTYSGGDTSESIAVTGSTTSLYVGDSDFSLTATPTGFAPSSYTWASTDEDVLTVSGTGTTGTVHAVGKGTAKVTASATGTNGTVTSNQYSVTVKEFSISVSESAVSMLADKAKTITLSSEDASGSVVYAQTSSDSSVATASISGTTLTITSDSSASVGDTATITVTGKDKAGASGYHQSIATIDVSIIEQTNLGGLVDGEKYFIIANGYYLQAFNNAPPATAGTAVTWPGDNNMPNADTNTWTFTSTGDEDNWVITSQAGNTLYATSTNNGLGCTSSGNDNWTVIDSGTNGLKLQASGGRYLTCYPSGTNFRTYTSTSSQTEVNSTVRFVKYIAPSKAATINGPANINMGSSWSPTSVTEDLGGATVTGMTFAFAASNGATLTATNTSTGAFTSSTAGTVTVSATKDGYTIADKVVTVLDNTPYISLEKDSTSGYTGQNETLSFTYGNLTGSLGVSSSNTSIVTVGTPSYSAGSGTVQINFVGAGDTTVKFKDGNTEKASIDVSVTASSVSITGLPASSNAYIGKTLNLGSLITVTATGSYSNAVTWDSEDNSIATVNSSGVVTGVASGTVDISVTSDDYPSATMTCAVTVSEAPLSYVIEFGATKNTNPTEIKTDASFKSTWSGNEIDDVTVGDFSKIYGVSSSQLKCGSGSASASISFTIPSDSYITSVVVVVETAGGSSMNVVSGASGAQTENQTISAGTLTFDDYFATEKSNYVLITSSASGAFYLSSITINYANFAAELTASPSSFDLAVNTSQNITLTASHFTPTSYSASVKSGSSLGVGAVSFSGSVATIAASSTTGVTVFTITGTGGGKTASVDVTVNVTQVRNLTDLSITTASNLTTFKVGDTFDVGSLVITATFDADPTTVTYSKAAGNIGLLTCSTAIGYEFQESDIGTITSVIFELEVGTGDEMVEYAISVIDKTYAAQVTDVQDLWEGQQIYFGDSEGTKVNIAHAGGNQLGSQDAVVHATKGLSVDELAHDGAYTVHRELIDSVVYYSFIKDGYYLEASSTSSNYLTRTDTLSDNCRYTISISNGEVTMTNKGNSSRPQFRWNSGSNWFSQYAGGTALAKAIIYALTPYSEQAVADAFEENCLHMSDYTSSQGWCSDSEHGYYEYLKPVWAAMSDDEKVSLSAEGEARLIAWANANGEQLDSDMNLVSKARINLISTITGKDTNTVAIIVIISMVSVTAIGGYFFLHKRKEN